MTYDELVSCWREKIGKLVDKGFHPRQRPRADHVLSPSHFPEVFECVIQTNNYDLEQVILETERHQKDQWKGDMGALCFKLQKDLEKIAFDGQAPSLAPPVVKPRSETGGRYGSNEHHK